MASQFPSQKRARMAAPANTSASPMLSLISQTIVRSPCDHERIIDSGTIHAFNSSTASVVVAGTGCGAEEAPLALCDHGRIICVMVPGMGSSSDEIGGDSARLVV